MVLPIPSAVPSMGTRRVVFIPGPVANLDTITLTEITSGENISCYLIRQNGWQAGLTENSIVDGRYCSAQDFEQPGTNSRTLNIQYSFNLDEPLEDEARLALKRGTEGTLVHFLQKQEESDTFEVGDWYEAVPVKMGIQSIVPVEDNAIDRITQKAFVTGQWTDLRQVVAATP